ncbi:hypothetical protein PoB_005920700 [Plakobranchus ocellatus]|uniref:Uncharacterized protein n=1 Tax=Plakobranchus ocellatus TaxID=259542 RepID=A0AAV4CM74_9GAST|nr:hypothetical protein PoB_005920700 [Plakobranchus ocellatus]
MYAPALQKKGVSSDRPLVSLMSSITPEVVRSSVRTLTLSYCTCGMDQQMSHWSCRSASPGRPSLLNNATQPVVYNEALRLKRFVRLALSCDLRSYCRVASQLSISNASSGSHYPVTYGVIAVSHPSSPSQTLRPATHAIFVC